MLLRRKRDKQDKSKETETWREGLSDEEQFWRDWLTTRGLEWPDDFARRVDPNLELQSHLHRYVEGVEREPIRVLDVGAGPLTVLGKHVGGKPLDLHAVDPLAPVYDRLLAECGVEPLVRTVGGEGERLRELYGPDAFDLTYAQNCLDHSYDPVVAVEQMLEVTRPGCFVVLEHAVNEGETQGYTGLHQWNFCEERGEFVVWRPDKERVNVTARIGARGEVTAQDKGGWLVVAVRKLAAG